MIKLGLCYHYVFGTEKNLERSACLFKLASNGGGGARRIVTSTMLPPRRRGEKGESSALRHFQIENERRNL